MNSRSASTSSAGIGTPVRSRPELEKRGRANGPVEVAVELGLWKTAQQRAVGDMAACAATSR